jgi:hypothetical protein
LERIQFWLRRVSVQTTGPYLGRKRRIRSAVNDRVGIEPKRGFGPGSLYEYPAILPERSRASQNSHLVKNVDGREPHPAGHGGNADLSRSDFGGVPVLQAERRGFESRFPLQVFENLRKPTRTKRRLDI